VCSSDLTEAQIAAAGTAPGADMVTVRVEAGVAAPASAEPYPELPLAAAVPGTTVTATFVPYFLWGNRSPEAMRVWVRTS